jgi:hypothetical protein
MRKPGHAHDLLPFISHAAGDVADDIRVFDVMILADWPDRTRIPELFSAVLYFAHSTAARP